MPRISRKNSKSCFYHVMVQGINKEHIFKETKYMEKYKKLMLEKLSESNVVILAYCIMINHVHILIYSENIEKISKYMQKVNASYARYYNKDNERVGYVFRDRYKTQEISSLRQLYTCLKYIHNNPVKAKIVSIPSEYLYSSYNEFINKKFIVNDMALEKLFGTCNNYIEQFKAIHNVSHDLKYDNEFIDEENKYYYINFIDDFEEKYCMKIELDILKKEKSLLRFIIKEARRNANMTYREIASVLRISKSKVESYDKK